MIKQIVKVCLGYRNLFIHQNGSAVYDLKYRFMCNDKQPVRISFVQNRWFQVKENGEMRGKDEMEPMLGLK